VLRDVSFEVRRGETLAIIGRSGCGKTTLLKALCALKPADKGEVWLGRQKVIEGSKRLFEEWEIRRHIMMVGQTTSLLPWLTALRNVALALEVVHQTPRAQADARARELGAELGLADVMDQYPEELSGGQTQRVQLARLAILQPEFMMLDEITSGIDPRTIEEVVAALYRLRSLTPDVSQTRVIVTHLLPFAYDFADQIIFLHDGIAYEQGPAQDFAGQARQHETLRFINSSTLEAAKPRR